MKRSADCEWRWLGAISPGRISCRPAYRLCVMHDSPRMPGLSRISTRRIASLAVISLPASIRYGRASRYFHSAGLHGVAGSLGIRLCSTSQSGARLCLSMRRYRSCRSLATLGFGTLAMVVLPKSPILRSGHRLEPHHRLAQARAEGFPLGIGQGGLARLADRGGLLGG